jgi:hypothetical protein
MAENETPADQVRSVMAKNLEQAHGAIANCFEFVEKSISASPLGATDRTKAFRSYVLQALSFQTRYCAQKICRMSYVFRQSSFKNNCKC